MAEMPWLLTYHPGPPYGPMLSFWRSELDAKKSAVGEVVDWLKGWHVGKVDFRSFLALVVEQNWEQAYNEMLPKLRKVHGPSVAIAQITPETFQAEDEAITAALKSLYKPVRGKLFFEMEK